MKPGEVTIEQVKAICGLRGILLGIAADQELSERELLFLDVWLRSQAALRHDPDALELLSRIDGLLRERRISSSELSALNEVIDDVIDFRRSPIEGEESQLTELLGLLCGIAADGILSDAEIEELRFWIRENANIIDVWPVYVIVQRINSMLADGLVTEEEREDLLLTIRRIINSRLEPEPGLLTGFLEDPLEDLPRASAKFCFAGEFVSGSRSALAAQARARGARVADTVDDKVDCLVIGSLAGRDWKHSGHGHDIERALRLKDEGCEIIIVSERTWLRHHR